MNASTGEIFFTSGGTESNNLALKSVIRDYGIKRIITSEIEHHCVLSSLEDAAKTNQFETHFVKILENGHIDLDSLQELLAQEIEPTLVSLMHANNELGNILEIEKVAEMCSQHNALFHSDSVQTVAHYRIDVQQLKVHFLTGSAHKFHGPKGSGFLYIDSDVKIKPMLHGGSQERNMRAGTENVYGIVGLGKAMELAYENLEEHSRYILDIKQYMIEQLSENIPGIDFNGDYRENSLYTVLNVSFPESFRSEVMAFNLDIAGIAASAGSACTSGTDVGSHVMQVLNANPKRKAIRFSFSKFTTKQEIDICVQKLKEMIQTPSAVEV